ncbi:Harbinger transposase-derived nuclease domain [Cinara cedri]|uniref:Harbinger transposase-derived nuclease domain n=1 Tax=Cinara cedri TaxID=506608 RepID=A0A5E4MF41_9HEMI|nr:Harbinger transposase-derived nuclease domain [Cinara cedri]
MELLVAEACSILSGVLAQQLKQRLTESDRSKLKSRKKRRWWKQWIQKRKSNGGSMFISRELRNENPEDFKNILRMSDTHFYYLLNKIKFKIQKMDTTMREAIPADIKLKLTLRYLATALIDHNYCFTYIDVGANGKASDGGLFQGSCFFEALENNILNTPDDVVFVIDDAFLLNTYLMKPYNRRNLTREQAIFNYRLSRAKRISENAFGILVSKFRIFERPIPLIAHKVDKIVFACCAIHNWLRKTSQVYLLPGLIDHEDYNYEITNGSWRQNQSYIVDFQPTNHRNECTNAKKIRYDYCAYVNGEGAVIWQWN